MNKKILAVLLLGILFAGLASAGNLEISSLSYRSAPAAPGSIVTVWVNLKNDSVYNAEDVLVRIDPEFPLSLQPGEVIEKKLGVISPFQTVTIEYKLLVDIKATDGDKALKVIVGEGFPIKEENFVISVLSGTPKLEIVGSSHDELMPGVVQPMQLTIKNVGGSIAKDIVLKINPERTVTSTGVVVEREIVSLGAIANYIEYLDKGDETTVELILAVNQDADLKNYSVPVTMEYYDQNRTSKSNTGYLGIKVTAEAEVDAVINSVSPKAFPGGTSEVVIDLFNIGLADAKYVVIELAGGNMRVAEPRQFIGTLEADDFDSFKTEISFDPATPMGSQPLSLNIIYKDEQLGEKIISKTLNIDIVNPGEVVDGGGPGLIVIGLISLALQLIGLYIVVVKWIYPRAKAYRQNRQKK